MEEATKLGLKMPPVVSSVDEYVAARELGQRIQATATCWEDIPEDVRTDSQFAFELFDSGLTAWHLPCFHVDIVQSLSSLYHWGRLEIARAYAKWLLETLPDDPIDPETRPKLEAYRDGTVSFGRLDSWCRWPQKPEFYRCHLMWRMVGVAEDAEADRRAEENTYWFMLKTGRGEEYVERHLKQLHGTGENLPLISGNSDE